MKNVISGFIQSGSDLSSRFIERQTEENYFLSSYFMLKNFPGLLDTELRLTCYWATQLQLAHILVGILFGVAHGIRYPPTGSKELVLSITIAGNVSVSK